jgi:transcriptional regulator with XRE-family HTH domain
VPKKSSRSLLAERIHELLRGQGVSQAELSRRSGIDRSTINRFLNGGPALSMQQIAWIACVLGMSLNDLGVTIGDEARRVLTDIESAIARAVAAETESAQLREQLAERSEELVAARRETAAALESGDARVAEAQARADDDHRKALDDARARAAKELAVALGHERERWQGIVQRLEGELVRARRKVDATTDALARANSEAVRWFQHAQALKVQLDKKAGEVVGVGLLAALGGLVLAENSKTRKRRR